MCYRHMVLVQGLPPKPIIRKYVITPAIGSLIRKIVEDNPRVAYRRIAEMLKDEMELERPCLSEHSSA
jgi:hypothetical protein